MFSVTVRDHFMIAHSFTGEVFGPAQRLHGATYVVDLEFRRPALDADGVVVDIGRAGVVLHEVLGALNFRNLDEVPEFAGRNTTDRVPGQGDLRSRGAAARRRRSRAGAAGIEAMRVTLAESHVAWAAYEAPISRG